MHPAAAGASPPWSTPAGPESRRLFQKPCAASWQQQVARGRQGLSIHLPSFVLPQAHRLQTRVCGSADTGGSGPPFELLTGKSQAPRWGLRTQRCPSSCLRSALRSNPTARRRSKIGHGLTYFDRRGASLASRAASLRGPPGLPYPALELCSSGRAARPLFPRLPFWPHTLCERAPSFRAFL